MPDRADQFVTLPGLPSDRASWVRLPEAAGTTTDGLWGRLLAGTYDKPILVEDEGRRALVFSIDGSVQSEMRLEDPCALVNEYTRKMMAFLLFNPAPRDVVMIGLGGGSLVKFVRRHVPGARMTVVEIDANVIALREQFLIPPDDDGLRVVHADGADYVGRLARAGEVTDVLLVDAYDRTGIARSIANREFLQDARSVVGRDGVCVINLAEYESNVERMLEMVREVFGGPVFSVRVGWGGNTVLFAGGALGDVRRLELVASRARDLQARLGLRYSRIPRLVDELLGRSAPG